ncbi:MAG: hypothetical protein IJV39_05585 [Ruminococcus sp.]|nr:hypothetical protein [Ruminococcus sp.]
MLKINKRLLCVLSIFIITLVLLLLSVTPAYADVEGDTGYYEPETNPPVVYTTAAPIEYTQEPVYTTAAPVYTTAAPIYTTAEPIYTTAAPVYTTVQEYYDDNSYEQYTQANQEYTTEYYEPPVTEFENQQDFYQEETTEPTEDYTSLYKSDVDDVDDTELKNSNWKKIAKELSAAQKSDDDSNSVFSYIKKKSNQDESFWDKLNWMLTAGIVCIVLAVASLVVFIVLTVKNKKRALGKTDGRPKDDSEQPAENIEEKSSSQAPVSKHGRVSQHAGSDGKYYIPRSERSSSDYGDDFGSDEKTKPEEETKPKIFGKDKSMENTAEIDISKY